MRRPKPARRKVMNQPAILLCRWWRPSRKSQGLLLSGALAHYTLLSVIVIPPWGYDEPGTLAYAISSICPASADGEQSNSRRTSSKGCSTRSAGTEP